MLPEDALATAAEWTAQADAVLAIGSTLSVYPAANVTLEVASRDQPFIILNDGPTEQNDVATLLLSGRAGELLPRLTAQLIA